MRLSAGLLCLGIIAGMMGLSSGARAAMDDYKFVKLKALDKSTARSETFVAEVGSTIQYGPLFIKIHACRKSQPIERPESVSFLQIWEVPPGAEKSTWIFSGWMFASSPALSAMDHPVYDVWVLDCQNDKNKKDDPSASVPPASEPKSQDDLEPATEEKTAEPAPSENSPAETPVTDTPPVSVPQEIPAPVEEPIPVEDTSPVTLPPQTQNMIPSEHIAAPPPPIAHLRPEPDQRQPVFKQTVSDNTDYALGSWAPPE